MRSEPCDGIVVLTIGSNVVISDRNCIVSGTWITPALVSCTVALYDPAPLSAPLTVGNATTVNATLRCIIGAAALANSAGGDLADAGVVFNNGCIAVVTGAGAQATVIFAKI